MNLLKRLASVMIVVVLVVCGLFSVNAFADEETEEVKPEIGYKITYSTKYTYLELTPTNKRNIIRYTTDGSKPKKSSSVYKLKLRTTKGATVRATEYTRSGEIVDSITVDLKRKCQKPEILIAKVKGGYKIAFTCKTDNVKIHYTTDGSKPGVDSPVFVDPFIVKKGTVIRFYAGKYNWKNSSSVKTTVKKANAEESDLPEAEVVVSSAPKIEYDEVSLQILELVNKEREKNGLPALSMNLKLCSAAQIRANEIVDYYDYGHTRPDGEHWGTVLGEVEYNFAKAGENTAYSEGVKSTAEQIVDEWMNSSVHRANILNDWGDETGIAWVKKANTTFWVQLFGIQQ